MTTLLNVFGKCFCVFLLSCCVALTAKSDVPEVGSVTNASNTDSYSKMKLFVENALHDTIESMDVEEETYAKYFSENYVQYVDGKTLNYNDFVAHMKAQKKSLKSAKVTIKHLVIKDDKIATVHIVDAVKKDGSIVKMQINAFFQVKNNQFILCDELTHLIKGEEGDRDLGSRKK